MMKKINSVKGATYQELTVDDHTELEVDIGAAKAFLELLYGCYGGIGRDEFSDDLTYLISDARSHLEKALAVLARAEGEVTP
jgi:hypothetical protein